METFLIGGLAVLIFVAGATFLGSKTPAIQVGTNNADLAECEALCNQLDIRRQQRCNAEAAENSARAGVNSLTAQLGVLSGLAIAAWFAFAMAPYPWLAAVLVIAAIAASILADVTAGQLFTANMDAHNKAIDAQTARNAEAQARQLLIENCKDPERIDACLLRPSPC